MDDRKPAGGRIALTLRGGLDRARAAWRRDRVACLVFVALAVTPLVLGVLSRGRTGYDDAFITYVYARSLSNGQGLTWNGVEGLGTSTPFFAALLAALDATTPFDVPAWGHALGWLSVAVAGVALFALGRREGWPWAGALAGFGWELAPLSMRLIGSEYQPAIAAALLAAWSLARGRAASAGAALGLAALFRAEAGLAAPLLAVAALAGAPAGRVGAAWRLVLRAALAAAAVAGAWLIVLQLLAGTVVPRTLEAKRAQAESTFGFMSPDRPLLAAARDPAQLGPLAAAGAARWPAAPWVLLAGGALALALRRRPRPFALALALWGPAHLVLVDWLDVSFYPWYGFPWGLSGLLVGAWALELPSSLRQVLPGTGGAGPEGAVAAPEPGVGTDPAGRQPGGGATAAVPWLLGLLAGGLVAASWVGAVGEAGRPGDPRRQRYGDLARRFDEIARPVRVAAIEVGFLGWSTRQRVDDLLGLVSPEVSFDDIRAGRLDRVRAGFDSDFLMLVPAPGGVNGAVVGDPAVFLREYELDHEDLATEVPLLVYRRRGAGGTAGAERPDAVGRVALDLLARRPAGARVVYRHLGRWDLLALPLEPGERLRFAVSTAGRRNRLAVRFAAGAAGPREGVVTLAAPGGEPLPGATGDAGLAVPAPPGRWQAHSWRLPVRGDAPFELEFGCRSEGGACLVAIPHLRKQGAPGA